MTDLTGTILAQRYQVVQFAGRGGMADVYKVWDSQRSVYLAMKVLRDDLAEDEIFLRRFRREAETLTWLQHPCIIRSYGLIQSNGLAFLLMDFIEGSTLRKEIFNRKTPWSIEQILPAMRPVCSALHFAHNQGLVHCDVKPANIMITAGGDVLLADFGIARLTESATTATMVGAGTPAYMAPEQIRGDDPQPQTDIYALGIILFELLTGGERPFVGEHAQATGSSGEKVRWEHVHRVPPSPRQYNPAIPVEVEAIVFKCLEKDPTRRYVSTMALMDALEHACPESKRQAASKWGIPLLVTPGGPVTQMASLPPYRLEPVPQQVAEQVAGSKQRQYPLPVWVMVAGLFAVVVLGAFVFSSFPTTSTPIPARPPATVSANILNTPTSKLPLESTFTPTLDRSSASSAFQAPTTVSPSPTQPTATIQPSPSPSASPTAGPSCAAQGQTWTRPKDKAVMVCVPAGGFPMGFPACHDSWCQNEANQGPVDLPAFWIDRYEVTNAQYQRFVSDTSFVSGAERSGVSEVFGDPNPVAEANWRSPQGPGSSLSGKDDHPVVQMNWFSANKYCEWVGGRLPSEAQWEKAARGSDGRLFPWGGDAPDKNSLNATTPGSSDNFRYTAPVGSFPEGISPYGLYDMAGNAYEWTRSLMKSYPYKPDDGREVKGEPDVNETMVLRGGSFYTDYGTVRSTWRTPGTAQFATDGTGFRCVFDR
jgi:serine/threonine-protein kinase